ncbi:MAG TPA: deoxyribonuclease IV [Pirellulaceae bacterium]|nr:deoxyribonuclease IV [Pirellulaceae bacterium]
MPILGAHQSIAGGFHRAVERAAAVGCETVQIFTAAPHQWPKNLPLSYQKNSTKNNNQWRAKAITEAEAEQFAAALAERKIAHPLSHSSYLINLASPDAALRSKSVESMIVELQRAAQLGIPYVVVHPGAHTTASLEEGLSLVAKSLDEIHAALPKTPAQILLEITAGQGSCLGHRFEHLAEILKQTKKPERVGICFDTCHAFAAGYDLRGAQSYKAMWCAFDDLLGIGRLKAIHLNDSKRELGSRVDRHEHIGRGHIGAEGFRLLLRDRQLREIPMYLETPKGDHEGETWDAINLRTLRELAKA